VKGGLLGRLRRESWPNWTIRPSGGQSIFCFPWGIWSPLGTPCSTGAISAAVYGSCCNRL